MARYGPPSLGRRGAPAWGESRRRGGSAKLFPVPGRTPSQARAGLSQFRWKSASRPYCRGHMFYLCSFSWSTTCRPRSTLPAGSAARMTRPGSKERRRMARALPRRKKRARRDRCGRRYRARRPRRRPRPAHLAQAPRHGSRRRPDRRRWRHHLEGRTYDHRLPVVRSRHARPLRDPHRRRSEPPPAQGDTPPRRPNRDRDLWRHGRTPTAPRLARTHDRRPPRCRSDRIGDRRRYRHRRPRRAPLRRRQAQARTPPARR